MSAALRLVGLAGLLALAGCITDPVTGKSVFGMPTSEAEEAQMGASYRPVIVQQFTGAYPDEALQSYLGSIVLGMAHASVRPDLPWNFTVLNSSVPNAFAVPGGEVFITRGLLWRMDDEAEFAMVMGHEVGHVEHRHSIQSMGRDSLIAMLGQLGGEAIGSEELGGLATTLVITRFSRDQERESDVQGVHNSYEAGYDPRQGADVFRTFLKMKQEQGGSESVMDAWTSTHPLDSERIENIQRLSREIDPRLAGDAPVEGLKVQTGRFAELIAKIRAEEKVYDRHDAALAKVGKGGKEALKAALPELEACAQALPSHAYFSNTVGKVYLALGDAEKAQAAFDRAASLGQGLIEPEMGLTVLALHGKGYEQAVAHANKALEILPGNYACVYLRGEGFLGMGRQDEAKRDFEAVVQSAPKNSDQYQAAAAHLAGQAPPAKKKKKQR